MLTTLWNGQVEFVEKHLLDPLKWGPVLEGIRGGSGILKVKRNRDGSVTLTRERPRRIFVNSMSDLFHENVTDEMRDRIFAVMALCPQHIFQVLTKRPERMLKYLTTSSVLRTDRLTKIVGLNFPIGTESKLQPIAWPLPNVWLGVSVENQAAADKRIPWLLDTPAAVRFVSCEPLLGPIDFSQLGPGPWPLWGPLSGYCSRHYPKIRCGCPDQTPSIDWVIAGGESGPNARPMNPDWARGLRDQCEEAGVPFFFKQWGEYLPVTADSIGPHVVEFDDQKYLKCGKKAAGSLLDGGEYKKFPEVNQ
jgi:protein gp37